ncbi:Murein DD-endopeptidase MepM and murein hydrolase activator NlpD, contain LysM domain [Saccharicrinis carchari]|uniref:Murein DD-endopeptidase MepM and murein hydrolase activator NlpD, contain LysM domain n=1 Tax=Saccharicrinis carchari TaxID=1168039 RepID=A0A521AQ98_SACCC|nr:peptidoglycan DD-metalloendopeptidase family protein [Saccharicrinis carchari]SMO36820.1 Murein DD-endopeptidase MepM and murein hydrolase activator NlpD, contain LysM domain [Saccharicrinis carchari]
MTQRFFINIPRLFLFSLIILLISGCDADKKKSEEEETKFDSLAVLPKMKPLNLKYGLPVDSFIVENNTVKRNEFLATILLKYKIPYNQIDLLAKKSKEVFDVRKIKVGNPYAVFMGRDSAQTAHYFVYEIDKINYIVYNLSDSAGISLGQKPVRKVAKTATGAITSSLWNAMTENNTNPVMALELSDIYAWTVDFFGIGKGDYFKVMYTENYVDSVSVGISSIEAALFHHRGDNYYAFNFPEDSVTYNYFDEDGKSLRKAFLKAPLKFSRISSRFSNSRFHPVLKIRRPHHGVDYAAPKGTHVFSIGDGRVSQKGYQARGGGNYLKIKHNSVYTTVYMHLNGFAKGIKKGTKVKQGQLIGYVGSTGLSTGPHLDYRVYKNGKPIDPLKIKAPPVAPVKKEDEKRFKAFYKPLKKMLDELALPVAAQ